MDRLVKSAESILTSNSLLEPSLSIVVGVSGGADSVALLLALTELRPIWSLNLTAAHVNYGLRGSESNEDERFVRNLCSRLSVLLQVRSERWNASDKGAQGNLQDKARVSRYSFFFDLAGSRNAVVATGHTLEDQAETFLMKLIRGSGPTGLGGIFEIRQDSHTTVSGGAPITVVRPLLGIGRAEVLAYLSRRQQPYRTDSSNRDLSFERNWIRHQLIPLLKERLNPNLIPTLARTADLFQEVGEFLESEGEKAFDRCRARAGIGSTTLRLHVDALRELPSILQKQVILRCLRLDRGNLRGIGQIHVDEVLELCEKQSGRELHLPGNVRVAREFDQLHFGQRRTAQRFSYELNVPGEIYVPEIQKRVVLRSISSTRDSEGILRLRGKTVKVRSRLPGDLYRLPGRSEKKLKEILIEQRIPKSARETLVLIESEDRLEWVEGLPSPPEHRPLPPKAYEIKVYSD